MSGAATVQKDDRDAPSSASSRRSSFSSTDTSPPPPSSASLLPSIAHVTSPSIPQTSCGCDANARNLVLCIDGTSNQFGGKNTNVVELYSRLVKDNDHQVTFYNSGIGTYVKPSWTSFTYIKQTLENYADMGIAWNFERIVLSAYLWLSERYEPGDRIFLFGFSRGAYQVRVLSAMIKAVGLIHRGNEDQIPFAYQIYAQMKTDSDAGTLAERFKTTFSRTVKVHFVGVWDTVSSVGVIYDKTLPGTTDGMTHVCFFRHALALHERRVKFQPEYVNGTRGPRGYQDPQAPHTKEVWFAGTHSDIGGGVDDNLDLNKFGPSLRWMTFEATRYGLLLDEVPRLWEEKKEEEVKKVADSLAWYWRPLEWLPMKRVLYDGSGKTTRWPNNGAVRVIQDGQIIHDSAKHIFEHLKKGEKPEGCATIGVGHKRAEQYERDPYADLRTIQKGLEDNRRATKADVTTLSSLVKSGYGRQALRDTPELTDLIVSSLATDARITLDIARVLVNVLKALKKRFQPAELCKAAAAVARVNRQLADELMQHCSTPAIGEPLRGHSESVSFAAFLSPTRVISWSQDGSVRIWDTATGFSEVLSLDIPISVACLAVHQSSASVAFGSTDGTFMVRDTETKQTWSGGNARFECLQAITFSDDGKLIAIGGDDNRPSLWSKDVELALSGGYADTHSGSVMCLAFSKSGSFLVSGSQDHDLRIWTVASADPSRVLRGHSTWVTSVCVDRADRIYSSSGDSLRIWDAGTEAQLFKYDVTSALLHMSLSADGKRLVTASNDGTITLRDVDGAQGASVCAQIVGHRERVWCVGFSPDGSKIVSASQDKTVALWDATDKWMKYE
ncbi:WD40 repeat-like protein [Exidia glandulosa HHB12029]|uniref:WD40 repeat-like protein n=1 Tax=Exidia glandulosa HHB12029 TaxID=1314781 RepID=A0A165MXJ3_EXIGL|nr:WD40 repeat-like protein [Exidia glandulosa HHB12029]